MSSEVKVKVSLQSGVQAGLTKIKAEFSEFRKAINGEVGHLLSAGALTAGIEGLIEKGAELEHLAHRFGLPVEALERFGNAAKTHGVSIEELAAGFNKLVVNAEKARQGSQELRDQFERLGISMEDIVSMSPEELFNKVADGVAHADNRSEAMAATIAVMGRNAGTLFTTLEMGSEQINKVGNSFGVMSKEAVHGLEQIHLAQERVKGKWAEWGGFAVDVFRKVGESAGVIAATIGNRFGRMFTVIGQGGSLIKNILTGDFAAAKKLAQEMTEDADRDKWVTGLKDDLAAVWQNKLEAPTVEHGKGPAPEIEDTGSETSKAEKIKELREKLNLLIEEGVAKDLEGQQKINELIAVRARLLEKARGTKDEEDRLKLQVEAEGISKQISQAKQQREKEIATAADALEKAQHQADYAALTTDDDRKAFILAEIDRLQGLVNAETDAAEKLKLQTEQVNNVQKLEELDKRGDKAPSVSANQLRRIGGQTDGGFQVGVASDKLLTEQREHKKILQSIDRKIGAGSQELLMQ